MPCLHQWNSSASLNLFVFLLRQFKVHCSRDQLSSANQEKKIMPRKLQLACPKVCKHEKTNFYAHIMDSNLQGFPFLRLRHKKPFQDLCCWSLFLDCEAHERHEFHGSLTKSEFLVSWIKRSLHRIWDEGSILLGLGYLNCSRFPFFVQVSFSCWIWKPIRLASCNATMIMHWPIIARKALSLYLFSEGDWEVRISLTI